MSVGTSQYSCLEGDRRVFRLLQLYSGEGPTIRCDLIEASFEDDDLIPYEALSYAWGDPEVTQNIQISYARKDPESGDFVKMEDTSVGVPRNLYLAFLHLRKRDECRVLWVDALCINQQNTDELNHQVRQMKDIYSRAHRVLFWLGTGTTDTDIFMDFLKRFHSRCMRFAFNEWQLEDKRWKQLWDADYSGTTSSIGLTNRKLDGIKSILKEPWFRRAWILQEVGNAKRATVCKGTRTIPAQIFAMAPSLLQVPIDSHCQAVIDIMPGPTRNQSWWSERRDLYTLLIRFPDIKASKAVDRIYALFGLCAKPEDTHGLEVDYNMELQDVISAASKAIFNVTEHEYQTISDIVCNATKLNTEMLNRMVQTNNAAKVMAFLEHRGGEVVLGAETVKAAAQNSDHAEEILKTISRTERGLEVNELILKALMINVSHRNELECVIAAFRDGNHLDITHDVLKIILETEDLDLKWRSWFLKLKEGRQCSALFEMAAQFFHSKTMEFLMAPAKRGYFPYYAEGAPNAALCSSALTSRYVPDDDRSLLQDFRKDVRPAMSIVQAGTRNRKHGVGVLRALLCGLSITAYVPVIIEEAKKNTHNGTDIVEWLLSSYGEDVWFYACQNPMSLVHGIIEDPYHRSRIIKVIWKSLATVAKSKEHIKECLMAQPGLERIIDTNVLQAAASNKVCGVEALEELVRLKARHVDYDEALLISAARNEYCGDGVVNYILGQSQGDFKITDRILKAAAANQGCGKAIFSTLLTRRASKEHITEEVIIKVIHHRHALEMIKHLVAEMSYEVHPTKNVVRAILDLPNPTDYVTLIWGLRPEMNITREVLQSIAGSRALCAILPLLGQNVQAINVEDSLLEAATQSCYRDELLTLLWDKGHKTIIRPDFIGFISCCDAFDNVFSTFLRKRIPETITEDHLFAVAQSKRAVPMMETLLCHRNEDITITKDSLNAILRLPQNWELINLLFSRRGIEIVLLIDLDMDLIGPCLESLYEENTAQEKVYGSNFKSLKDEIVVLIAGSSNAIKLLSHIRNAAEFVVTDKIIEAATVSAQYGALSLLQSWSENRQSQFCAAAKEGHTHFIISSLKRGIAPEKKYMLFTPLWLAAREGYTEIVRVLLSTDSVNIHFQGRARRTPLFVAATRGHVEIVKILLSKGAHHDLLDARGRSPLEVAQYYRYSEVVAVLLKAK